jgi:hypothetical protein
MWYIKQQQAHVEQLVRLLQIEVYLSTPVYVFSCFEKETRNRSGCPSKTSGQLVIQNRETSNNRLKEDAVDRNTACFIR